MPEESSEFVARWRQAQAGQRIEEFEATYGHHVRHVARRRIAEMGLQNEVDAGDLVDSAYRSLLLRPDQIEAMAALDLLKYMQTAVRRKAITLRRKEHVRRRTAGGGVNLDEPSDAQSGNPVETSVEFDESLRIAMRTLTWRERRICALRQSGVRWPAIAIELGASVAAVRTCFYRAVRRVRVFVYS